MGWIKLGSRTNPRSPAVEAHDYEDLKGSSQHIEVSISPETSHQYNYAPLSLPDNELPFIKPEDVAKRKSAESGGLFIVVDEVVYNCTEFLIEHPGGEQVIKSFAGCECSWQFWRFHGKYEMEKFGKPLRVGRTHGMENKFKEPVRYVGLKKLGDDWF